MPSTTSERLAQKRMVIPTRFSKIDSGLGPTLDFAIITEISTKKATHVCLHANKITTLDLYVSTQYRSKNREEDVLRSGAQDLVHVLDLDVSSNSLHEEYSLPRPGATKKVSLLGLCINLMTLNLSSNGLTQTTFDSLFNGLSSEGLARLQTLDISHNQFTQLPDLHATFPSMKNLFATNNKLKSLTSLLQTLHKYRGMLEKLQLASKNIELGSNPVCLKNLYREKVIFVLGSQLVQLDCCKISSSNREKARRKLEQGLSVYSEDCVDRECEPHNSPPLSLRGNSRTEQLTLDQEECHSQDDELEVLHDVARNDTTTAESIKTLEKKITSLTKIIEKQTAYTPSCDAKNGCDNNPASALIEPSGDCVIQSSILMPLEARYLAMCQRQRKAAIVLLKSIIENIESRKRQRHTQLTFRLWRLSTRSHKHLMRAKEHATKSEKKWLIDTQQLVNRAINEEAAKGKKQLELSKQKFNAMISKLKLKVKSLEGHLEEEVKKDERSSEAINILRVEVQRVEETRKKDVAKAEECARCAKIEADSLRKELQQRKEDLDEEEYVNSSEIQRLSRAHEEVMDLAAINAKQVNQLMMEVNKKDDTIKTIKGAYEQAARRSASDRSRCEQSLASEQQVKDLLSKHMIKLKDLEAEMGRVVADNESKQSENALKISRLSREIEEKDRKILDIERRMKSSLDDRDDKHTQLMNSCEKVKFRLEERIAHLQTQLDKATDTLRQSKLSSVDKQLFDEAVSRAADLKRSLERQHELSQQQEEEENKQLQSSVAKYEKMVKSLSGKLQTAKQDYESREKQIESMNRLEIQKLKDQTRYELASMECDLKAERSLRLGLVRKAAATESDNEKQRLKMRNAIDSLAKQLAVGT